MLLGCAISRFNYLKETIFLHKFLYNVINFKDKNAVDLRENGFLPFQKIYCHEDLVKICSLWKVNKYEWGLFSSRYC